MVRTVHVVINDGGNEGNIKKLSDMVQQVDRYLEGFIPINNAAFIIHNLYGVNHLSD